MIHEITTHRSPIDFRISCSCGWSFRTTRRQNALGRAAKIKAAIRRHLLENPDDAPSHPE